MASRTYGQVLHQIERLFRGGSVAGLSEWQLLDRYASLGDEAAFEALVTRHGPMVLGVCRRMLADPHAVEDAFQATFLVLVRRAGALGPRDAVGHWLYGVAVRVALRARCESARRRSREVPVEWAQGVALAGGSGVGDLAPILDEELGRLPAKYRAPLVLCYLEGLTHEEAARQLHWPLGSVKGRLARARDLLKTRLARRGVAPSAGLLAATLARDAGAAVPEPLRLATLRAALGWVSGSVSGKAAPAVVSASVVHLMEGGLSAMFLTKLKVAAAVLGTCGGLALGAWALAQPSTGGKPEAGAGGPPALAAQADAGSPEERQKALSEALAKPLNLELRKARLEDVLKSIKSETTTEGYNGVPIYVEPEGLAEAGADLDRPVTIDARKAPLLSALDQALRPLKLAATTRDGLLVVTSRQEAALIEVRKLNEVLRGKLPGSGLSESADVSPAQWLGRMADHRTFYAAGYDDESDPEAEARTQAILEALKKPVSMSFANETPLEDVLKYIQAATEGPGLPKGIPIYVDPVGLQEAEKTMSSPVTLDLEGVALRESLRLALKQLGLVYTVSDGLLSITQEYSEGTFTPILRLADKATLGSLSLREMNDLIALFEAREKVLRYAEGKGGSAQPSPTAELHGAGGGFGGGGFGGGGGGRVEPTEDARTELIKKALERVVPLHFDKIPISAAIAEIRKATIGAGLPQGIPVYLNPTAVKTWVADDGKETDASSITFDLENVKLKTALRLLLSQEKLGYVVKEGLVIIDKLDSPELAPNAKNPN